MLEKVAFRHFFDALRPPIGMMGGRSVPSGGGSALLAPADKRKQDCGNEKNRQRQQTVP